MRKKTILLFFLSQVSLFCFGQRVEYEYDDAGNRIAKTYLPIIISREQRNSNYIVGGLAETDDKVTIKYKKDKITISIVDYEKNSDSSVEVCSVDGKVIEKIHIDCHEITYPTNGLPNGVYVVNVSVDEYTKVWKFIKE